MVDNKKKFEPLTSEVTRRVETPISEVALNRIMADVRVTNLYGKESDLHDLILMIVAASPGEEFCFVMSKDTRDIVRYEMGQHGLLFYRVRPGGAPELMLNHRVYVIEGMSDGNVIYGDFTKGLKDDKMTDIKLFTVIKIMPPEDD